MYNWNVDLTKVNKNRKQYKIWHLNQLINFGLNGEKIDLKLVKKYWTDLELDKKRKNFLSYLLWGKLS